MLIKTLGMVCEASKEEAVPDKEEEEMDSEDDGSGTVNHRYRPPRFRNS